MNTLEQNPECCTKISPIEGKGPGVSSETELVCALKGRSPLREL